MVCLIARPDSFTVRIVAFTMYARVPWMVRSSDLDVTFHNSNFLCILEARVCLSPLDGVLESMSRQFHCPDGSFHHVRLSPLDGALKRSGCDFPQSKRVLPLFG
jgi:hypothetical protein